MFFVAVKKEKGKNEYLGIFTNPEWAVEITQSSLFPKKTVTLSLYSPEYQLNNHVTGFIIHKNVKTGEEIEYYGFKDQRGYPLGYQHYCDFMEDFTQFYGEKKSKKIIQERKKLSLDNVLTLAKRQNKTIYFVKRLENNQSVIKSVYENEHEALGAALSLIKQDPKVQSEVYSIPRNTIYMTHDDFWANATCVKVFNNRLLQKQKKFKIDENLEHYFPIP